MSETTPETEGAHQETAQAAPVDVTPEQPTTSPDVTITDDPGTAPEGEPPADGDEGKVIDVTPDDPQSDDPVENA